MIKKLNTANMRFVVLLLLLLFASLSICSVVSAEEPVYLVTEAELMILEQNSMRLLEISKQSAQELLIVKEQLKLSEIASIEAIAHKEQLQKQLTEQEALSENLKDLLQKTRNSLTPSAPEVLREYGAKIDVDDYIRGFSFGISRRIGSCYIGIRGEYDWHDKESSAWLTFAY